MDGNCETTISYIKIWNHPIETTIYKQMFQVPGSYMDSSRKARIHILSEYVLLFLINPMLAKGSKYKNASFTWAVPENVYAGHNNMKGKFNLMVCRLSQQSWKTIQIHSGNL